MTSDQEPRYRLVDANGNIVGSLYGKPDGSVAIQETDSGADREVTLAPDGTFSAPSVETESVSTERLDSVWDHIIRDGDDLEGIFENEVLEGDSVLISGTHRIDDVRPPENSTVKVRSDATIEAEDGAFTTFHIVGDSDEDLIQNVTLIIDGLIDGRGEAEETVEIDRAEDCTIKGSGVIKGAAGGTVPDGLDADRCRNLKVSGLTFKDNHGYGLHLGGSSTENIPDQSALIVNCKAEGNGFENNRAGFDANPRWDDVTYVNCISKDNRQNWEFARHDDGRRRGVAVGCTSIDTGDVEVGDDLDGALFAQIDNSINNEFFIVDGDEELDEAIEAANNGASIWLLPGGYTENRTINTRLNIYGTATSVTAQDGSIIVDATWTLSERCNIRNIAMFSDDGVAEIVIEDDLSYIGHIKGRQESEITVNADNVGLNNISGLDITFASGTSGGAVGLRWDSSFPTTITDNGDNEKVQMTDA